MSNFLRFICAAAALIVTGSDATAAVTLSFSPQPVSLSPIATSGSVDVQWQSATDDAVGAFDLRLVASNFSGGAASVTIDSFTVADPTFSTLFILDNSPDGTVLSEGDAFKLEGFFTTAPTAGSPETFATINFSLSAPLTPSVDSFQFNFEPPTSIGSGGAEVFAGSTPVTVSAVPEPGSMALCGVLAVAGVTRRQLRRRRERKSLSLAS